SSAQQGGDACPVLSYPADQPEAACENLPQVSACFGTSSHDPPDLQMSYGFPLNLNLWEGFGPPDFPPVSVVPELSSLPLISRESREFRAFSRFRERAVHNGVVDLIPGQPLLQEIDFELPFGSATFRHVRTYNENCAGGAGGPEDQNRAPEDMFWDWNGL